MPLMGDTSMPATSLAASPSAATVAPLGADPVPLTTVYRPLLARFAAGSGRAEAVDGGFRISGRKVFTSACLAGDMLMTGAVLEGPDGSAEVLHFGVPMRSDAVTIVPTWRTMAMRGTGSHDVLIDGHIV